MLVQKTVTTNTNFAGRLSEGMLRKTSPDGKAGQPNCWKSTCYAGNNSSTQVWIGEHSESADEIDLVNHSLPLSVPSDQYDDTRTLAGIS
jgi:hypothetical protein